VIEPDTKPSHATVPLKGFFVEADTWGMHLKKTIFKINIFIWEKELVELYCQSYLHYVLSLSSETINSLDMKKNSLACFFLLPFMRCIREDLNCSSKKPWTLSPCFCNIFSNGIFWTGWHVKLSGGLRSQLER